MAAISLLTTSWPPEHQIPRRIVVSSAMAAGIAAIGVLTVPPCCELVRHYLNSERRLKSTYDRGIETSRGPSVSSDELLGNLELICVTLLVLDGSVRVSSAVVEALQSLGRDDRSTCGEGSKRGGRTHIGERCYWVCNMGVMLLWMCILADYATLNLFVCLSCIFEEEEELKRVESG